MENRTDLGDQTPNFRFIEIELNLELLKTTDYDQKCNYKKASYYLSK